jgi:hypothetical protein
VQAFSAEGLAFPARIRTGPHKGELSWMPLRHWRVLRTLHNPRYAGAFVYGRHRGRRGPDGKTTFETVPRDQWTALIPDAHVGYITWAQFELNGQLLAANSQAHGDDRAAGPAREGPALLQGLVVCGRCGQRMSVGYKDRHGTQVPRYRCVDVHNCSSSCCSVSGTLIDAAISQLLLDTVTPLALEVALTVQGELEHRANEADALRRSHVERARHRTELARRRYLAVDPDNRLVADTLEADWNDALRQLHQTQQDYERASTAAHVDLNERNQARIRALATDFPALWSNPATPHRERKRIARLLIDDVTITKTDQINLHVRFRGGQTTSLAVPIPLPGWKARQTNPDTLTLLNRLLDNHTDAGAAEALNAAGHRSGTGQPFTATLLLHLRRGNNLPSHHERLRAKGMLTMAELAQHLGVHPSTIKAWNRAGRLKSHKANDGNLRLFEPPTPGDPNLVKHQGIRVDKRVSTQPSPGGAI